MNDPPSSSVRGQTDRVVQPGADKASLPPCIDRPLTIPLLVRGSLNRAVVGAPLVVAAVFLCMALYVLLFRSGPLNPVEVAVYFGGFAVGLLHAGPAILWLIRQRCWLEVTLTGLVLCDRRGRHAFADEAVQSVQLCWQGEGRERGRKVLLDVQGPNGLKRFALRYAVPEGAADPLAGVWDRLERSLARRALERLGERDVLIGSGWRLTAGQLVSSHHRCDQPLSAITRVGTFDRRLCIWIGEEETPWLRLPQDGRNVGALLRVLESAISSPPPLPGRRFGRRLFTRRASGWTGSVSLCVIGVVLLAVLASIGLGNEEQWPTLALVAFLPATLLLFGGISLVSLKGGWWLAVYEEGLIGSRKRRLHHKEMGALTWKERMLVESWPELVLRPVVLCNPPRDEDMIRLRDELAEVIAAELQQRLAAGQTIEWTARCRLLPDALECQSRRGKTVRVPFAQLRWTITAERITFFTAADPTPIGSEMAGERNFFPVVRLLDQLQAQPGETVQTPAIPPDPRITTHAPPGQSVQKEPLP
jgi:hypothetical protein